jgi:hypothetical protein
VATDAIAATVSVPAMGTPGAGKAADSVASANLGETGPLSQEVQARKTALRIRHINGMEVRQKRPRGFKKEAQAGFK